MPDSSGQRPECDGSRTLYRMTFDSENQPSRYVGEPCPGCPRCQLDPPPPGAEERYWRCPVHGLIEPRCFDSEWPEDTGYPVQKEERGFTAPCPVLCSDEEECCEQMQPDPLVARLEAAAEEAVSMLEGGRYAKPDVFGALEELRAALKPGAAQEESEADRG